MPAGVKVRSDNRPYPPHRCNRTLERMMPQITVDYSAELDDSLDRRGFAGALHPLVAETVTTKIAACKTRFRRIEEFVAGDAATGDAIVHISIALLPGRTEEIKARLTASVLELLGAHLKPVDGLTVHASAETRELARPTARAEPSSRLRQSLHGNGGHGGRQGGEPVQQLSERPVRRLLREDP